MRVLEPREGLLAFYDGRSDPAANPRGRNWVEFDLVLGVASYALLAGRAAIVFDTHTSPDRGAFIRAELEARGIQEIAVVFSHWHLDHVAGAQAFGDCPIVSTERTKEHLTRKRHAITSGTELGPPAIDPLLMPTETFGERTEMSVGDRNAELIHVNVHSDDAAVLWLADESLLLAGDTLEDTVTFVDDPGALEAHLEGLDRLAALRPQQILPAHGDPARIAAGGYGPGFIDAARRYTERLIASREDESLQATPLAEFLAEPLAAGDILLFEPYETVHKDNLRRVVAHASGPT